jgi:hypothetical protein
VVWDFFQTAIIYFFIPETKNRTVSDHLYLVGLFR